MTTTEQELTRIQGAKSALRDAILAKGATLSEDARIDEYAPALQSARATGASPIRVKDGNNFMNWGLMESLPDLDVSELANAYAFVYGCSNLKSLTLSLPKCTNASHLATNCSNLNSASLDMPICTNADRLLSGCANLQTLELSLPQCTNATFSLDGCRSLESVSLDLPECTHATALVHQCSNLKSLTLSLAKCTDANYLAGGCNKLVDAKISGLKTSLSLQDSRLLSVESVQYIVEHAQEAMEGAVLTLPRALESKLPEETIEAALGKGFEVAFR